MNKNFPYGYEIDGLEKVWNKPFPKITEKKCRCGKPRMKGKHKCYDCISLQIRLKQKEQRAKEKAREIVRRAKKKIKRESNPRRWKNKLDKLWREKVIEMWGDKCVICSSLQINIHHIIGRRNLATRWSVNNGVPLCALHHTFGIQSAHQHPVWFLDEIVNRRGFQWLKDLQDEGNLTFNKNYEEVFEKLSTV
jgi:hypothetical protein